LKKLIITRLVASLRINIGIELCGRCLAFHGQCGGVTGAFAELHPDGFEADAAPADVRGADGDGDEEVFDFVREDRAIRHLRGAGFFAEEENAVRVATGRFARQAGDGIDRPVGHGDAVGVDRCAGDAFGDDVVLLFENVAPDEPPRLADVDLIRRVVVVGELIGGEAVVLELLAILLRRFGIVLHPPEAHEHAIEVAL
jgi:hypothetical protein